MSYNPRSAVRCSLYPTRCSPARSPVQPHWLTLLDSALTESQPRKPFRMCTSAARLDLRISKDLPPSIFLSQLLCFQHLRAPFLSAGNKGLITPVESALTKRSSATPLESALTKTPGGGGTSHLLVFQVSRRYSPWSAYLSRGTRGNFNPLNRFHTLFRCSGVWEGAVVRDAPGPKCGAWPVRSASENQP